ncbi:carbohydrate ABC transporter permease [Natronospirillum operosum]|uniref:Carbohydrate ABC transporter permease n=1 Tax=Natronospirillum operosum TaxID=2759953 RepID=A0A4Z0WAB8_9GAMM|nr:carbohydrate ABC transporter permease [Natronospirillum operosum]TGG91301.1 carbohydrate ABC transporter permease [Natronospirillum operosum]
MQHIEQSSLVSRSAKWGLLLLTALFVLLPFWITVLGGFKTLGELRVAPLALPRTWDTTAYMDILLSPTTWRMMMNSLIITGFTVSIVLITASMLAFTFSHMKFAGRNYIYSYVILGMMFPGATAILPLFIKVRDLGLLDTYAGVILPQVAFGLAMSVLLFRTFFEQLPKDLFEAALVDGCSYGRFFWTIVMPLSQPILATVGVFILVQSWNNYIFPLIMLNDRAVYPWPLGLMEFRGQYGAEWNRILAYITVTIMPAVAFFLYAQKYIVAGLTGGAVKG